MNVAAETSVHTLQPFALDREAVYPIDTASHLSRVPRHLILVYCKRGLVSAKVDPEYGGYYFNYDAIRRLQTVDYLLTDCGINDTGIQIILSLVDEVERLRARPD